MHRPSSILLATYLLSSLAAAQGADDCASAQVLGSSLGPHLFDNTTATKDGPHDCNGEPVRKDVWFRWTAPATGGYVITDCGNTSFQTRYNVYDYQACPVTSAPLVDCAQSGCAGIGTRFSFPTLMGRDYLIRVGAKNFNQAGAGQFTLTFDPCWQVSDDGFEDNDSCDTVAPLDNGTYPGLKAQKHDQDWFLIDIEDGATVQVDAIFLHAGGNIETWLYDDCGGALLANGGSIDDNETVTWTNATGSCLQARFMVEIWLSDPGSECNTYDLIVQGAAPPGTCSGNIGTNYCGPSVPNSSGLSAEIAASGSTNVATNDVLLTASKLPFNQFGMFVNSMSQGTINPPGSQGVLCLSGGIGRYNAFIKNTGPTGEFSLQLDLTQTPTPGGIIAIQPGETWYFSTWFRDSNPTPTSNFTDGVGITFQ